ncbi:MAG TPA: hypothetical protein VJ936_09535, partial [Desulfobacteraceae bacterium]|nr:hypothetical protein [Desulfobacteraceae bacterium]
MRPGARQKKNSIDIPGRPVILKKGGTLVYARVKDPRLQSAMLEAMLPLVHTGQGNIGSMDSSVWKGMYSAMY